MDRAPGSQLEITLTSDLDIYRSARLLIDQHGDEAAIRAAERVDKLSDIGDLDGAATWCRILDAVRQMRDRTAGGTMH